MLVNLDTSDMGKHIAKVIQPKVNQKMDDLIVIHANISTQLVSKVSHSWIDIGATVKTLLSAAVNTLMKVLDHLLLSQITIISFPNDQGRLKTIIS